MIIGGVELLTLFILISAGALAYAWVHKQWLMVIIPAVLLSTGFGGMPLIANLFLMGLLVAYLAVYSGLFDWLNNKLFPHFTLTKALLAAPALWLISDWPRLPVSLEKLLLH